MLRNVGAAIAVSILAVLPFLLIPQHPILLIFVFCLIFELNQTRYNEIATRAFEILVSPKTKASSMSVSSVVRLVYRRIFLVSFVLSTYILSFAISSILSFYSWSFISWIIGSFSSYELPAGSANRYTSWIANFIRVAILQFIFPFLAFEQKAYNRGWSLDRAVKCTLLFDPRCRGSLGILYWIWLF